MAPKESPPSIRKLPALGRPVYLGQLYDCRSDTIVKGKCLWGSEVISRVTKVHTVNESSTNVFVEETAWEKRVQLGIGNDLMVSILGDLVSPLSGASRYLNDEKLLQDQERVTLKYKCTTKFEELDIESLTKEYVNCPDTFLEGEGTHVVCGIYYGGQAFIALDKMLDKMVSRESSPSTSTSTSLLEAAQYLPNCKYNSQGRLDIPEDKEKETRGVRYLLYSDFSTPYKPSTYREAARLINSFPHFVMNGAVKAIPVDICLYPLYLLSPTAASVVRNIDENFTSRIECTLAHLQEVIATCETMSKGVFLTQFKDTAKNIKYFKKLVQLYKGHFHQQTGAIVTRIRSGTINEDALGTILDRKEASPFAKRILDTWVKQKHTQLHILSMENITSITASPASDNASECTSARLATPAMRHEDTHSGFLISLHISVLGGHSVTKMMDSYLQQVQNGVLPEYLTANTDVPHSDYAQENALQQAELFKNFVEANCSNISLKFAITEDTEENGKPDFYISVERDGVLLHDVYNLPGKPECVKLVKAFHDRLQLQMSVPEQGDEHVRLYEIQYITASGSCEETVQVDAETSNEVIELSNLELGTTYNIRVRSLCEIGTSVWSSRSSFKTLSATPPGKPTATREETGIVHLEWPKPLQMADSSSVQNYIISVYNLTTKETDYVRLDFQEGGEHTFSKLNKSSRYAFSVRAALAEGETDDGNLSEVLEPTANTMMKQELLKDSKMIKDGAPRIYELNIRQSLHGQERIRRCSLGQKRDGSEQKVILVVGATGAGKTTLLNGIVNYILGVEWEDNFRFKLIVDSEEAQGRSQAESQTRMISSYTLHYQEGFKIPFSLTVIDTPGFGDTSGITRDREITQQIRNFFMSEEEGGINYIDAIGFVAQAALARLTPTQQFIFDQVLALFGNDVKENIFLLATFADGKKPSVLAAADKAEIPYQKFFTFNNSALFIENGQHEHCGLNDSNGICDDDSDDGGSDFDKGFWNMSTTSFVTFFRSMNETKPRSLVLTKDVLNERHRLETLVPEIHKHISTGRNKLEELHTEIAVLKKHEKDIETNKKFTYKVTEEAVKTEQIPSGKYITNCLTCNFTCHYPCKIENDEGKRRCDVMTNGHCMVCPSRCIWDVHKNMNRKFVTEKVTKTKTVKELKDRYLAAKAGRISAGELIKAVENDIKEVQLKVLFFTDEIRKCLERLQDIALKPNPFSTVAYIDMLITSEKSENHPQRNERLRHLEEVKKQAEILQQLEESGFDPFKEYRDNFLGVPENSAKSNSEERTILHRIKHMFSVFSQSI